MTNLEFYKDEINNLIKDNESPYSVDRISDAFRVFSNSHLQEFKGKSEHFIKWLLRDHKETNKLTQVEIDCLKSWPFFSQHDSFQSSNFYTSMKALGYFRGILDVSLTINEIKNNYEVVSEDYFTKLENIKKGADAYDKKI